MRAGGHYSDFKLVQSTSRRNAKFERAIAEATPFNYSARGDDNLWIQYSYDVQKQYYTQWIIGKMVDEMVADRSLLHQQPSVSLDAAVDDVDIAVVCEL